MLRPFPRHAITIDQINEFDSRLTSAEVEHDIHVYPRAPPSFFDRRYEQFADACEDA
jgi:carboxymethylenebutenolidase